MFTAGIESDPASLVAAAPLPRDPAGRSGDPGIRSTRPGAGPTPRRDALTLSPGARAAGPAQAPEAGEAPDPANPDAAGRDPTGPRVQRNTNAPASTAQPRGADGQPLSPEEQKQVEELKARDQEVRQHEQAHKAAAGPHATSGPTFSFQVGPDGKRYAVGGEVGIDTSPVPDDPQATVQKMETVRRAALAPAEPSPQDFKVAAQAAQTAAEARRQLAEERSAELRGESDPANAPAGVTQTHDAAPDRAAPEESDDAREAPPPQSGGTRFVTRAPAAIGGLIDLIG